MLLNIGNNRDMVITSHQSIMRLVTWLVMVTRGPFQILILSLSLSNETRWPHSVTNHPAAIVSST